MRGISTRRQWVVHQGQREFWEMDEMNPVEIVFLCYLAVINVIGFCVMGFDKKRAKKHKWRVKERTLFLIAVLLGSAGSWIGMYVFRHKTKHWYFVIGMPAILAAQIAAGIWLYVR